MTDFSNIGAINGVPQKLSGGGYYTKDEMDNILKENAEWIVSHVHYGARIKSMPQPEPPETSMDEIMAWGKAPIFAISAALEFVRTEIDMEAADDEDELSSLESTLMALRQALEYILKYYKRKET